MPYLFDVDGRSWTSEDYTLDEMCAAESETKVKWEYLDPTQEAEARRAMIAAYFTRTMPADEARKQAGALTGRQVSVTTVKDDRPIESQDGIPIVDPPKATAEGATT